ncbi:MAG: hypothetical protein MH252_06040 [Thermosynechococcaceae cyanobacterium MS004]|nr:hypothetical protein [Thermosynechococcaceae cyanobacterium MS004]
MTSNLALAQPQKPRKALKRRVTAILLSTALIGSPVLIASNAQAISVASALKYIQQAQKILQIIKVGKNGIGKLSLGNLSSILGLFGDLNIKELDGVLKSFQKTIDSLDPDTKKLIAGIGSTVGQLGIPIPNEVNQLVKAITKDKPTDLNSPFGTTKNQALLSALNISSDSVVNSVLGEGGQESLKGILDDSQTSWQAAGDIIQTNGGAIITDSVATAIGAQFAFSSQDVLKAITIQNAQHAVLAQQVGAAGVENAKIDAMSVNLQAKDLVIGAKTLEVEQFQANQLAAGENARQADTQGAFNSAITNAYMFSCLSEEDCK